MHKLTALIWVFHSHCYTSKDNALWFFLIHSAFKGGPTLIFTACHQQSESLCFYLLLNILDRVGAQRKRRRAIDRSQLMQSTVQHFTKDDQSESTLPLINVIRDTCQTPTEQTTMQNSFLEKCIFVEGAWGCSFSLKPASQAAAYYYLFPRLVTFVLRYINVFSLVLLHHYTIFPFLSKER